MGKNDKAKQTPKAATYNSPIMTRGASKSKSSAMDNNNLNKPRRSTSTCSTDQFESLEKKLQNNLLPFISEKLELFDERLLNTIQELVTFRECIVSIKDEIVNLNREMESLKCELNEARNELDNLHRVNRLSDAVITGVPCLENENPQELLSTISAKICHNLSPYTTAFRPKRAKGRKNNVPLIVKFSCSAEQSQFIKKFKKFGPVKLRDIDKRFLSDARVFAFESLSRRNNKILRSALQLKKDNQVQSVFTRGGLAYIQVTAKDSPVQIISLEALSQIVKPSTRGYISPETNSTPEDIN